MLATLLTCKKLEMQTLAYQAKSRFKFLEPLLLLGGGWGTNHGTSGAKTISGFDAGVMSEVLR